MSLLLIIFADRAWVALFAVMALPLFLNGTDRDYSVIFKNS